jgi:hypothetical protein
MACFSFLSNLKGVSLSSQNNHRPVTLPRKSAGGWAFSLMSGAFASPAHLPFTQQQQLVSIVNKEQQQRQQLQQ